jgi:hypothetical protein
VVPASTLPPPRFAPPPQLQGIVRASQAPPLQQIIHDQIRGTVTVEVRGRTTTVLDRNFGTFVNEQHFRCSASSKDPSQASIVATHTFELEREDGKFQIVAESSIRATASAFHILINLQVNRNGQPFFHKAWTATEPRRLL